MSPIEYVARELCRKDIQESPNKLTPKEIEALRVLVDYVWSTGKILRSGVCTLPRDVYDAHMEIRGLHLAEKAATEGTIYHYTVSDDRGLPVDPVNVEWAYYKPFAEVAISAYERWLEEKIRAREVAA